MAVRWHRAGYVASFYQKEEWGGAHFTLPPSPKLTVKCPALKDCHLKSSSAGPPVWLCSTLRLCAFTETLKLTLEGAFDWCSSVQESLCSATTTAWVQGSAVTFSQWLRL